MNHLFFSWLNHNLRSWHFSIGNSILFLVFCGFFSMAVYLFFIKTSSVRYHYDVHAADLDRKKWIYFTQCYKYVNIQVMGEKCNGIIFSTNHNQKVASNNAFERFCRKKPFRMYFHFIFKLTLIVVEMQSTSTQQKHFVEFNILKEKERRCQKLVYKTYAKYISVSEFSLFSMLKIGFFKLFNGAC